MDNPRDPSFTRIRSGEFGDDEPQAEINLRPTALSGLPAQALGVAVGTPCLYLSRTVLDQFDEVVELDQEFWRHDAIDICVSATGRPKPEATE